MDVQDTGMELFPVLEKYGFRMGSFTQAFLGSGLINQTWHISDIRGEFVLQRINSVVFKNPESIANNIHLIGEFLTKHHPDYYFTRPVASVNGEEMIYLPDQGFFRLFPFVKGSISYDVVPNPQVGYEASKAFGRFSRLLEGLEISRLELPLPGFHYLSTRYCQFEESIETGNKSRVRACSGLIGQAKDLSFLVDRYESIRRDPGFHLRATHHDTKISNVLFDSSGKAICVIDLDTVMPGYFISDLGDMMRTYLSPVSEEEQDLTLIQVREEYKAAVLEGYLSEMRTVMTPSELDAVSYAGPFIVYMQALRFLTDHLNDDRYYGARYEGHNLVRAQNQFGLLEALMK